MKRRFIAYMQCKGGCGKRLATATRLGTAAMRQKYAGYCDECMPADLNKEMQADSLAHQLKVAAK